MLSVRQLTNIDLMVLSTRPHTGGVNLKDPDAREQLTKGDCFAITDNHEVFAAAGIYPLWGRVGWGWACIAIPTGTRRLLFVTRRVRKYLAESDWVRVQTTCSEEFAQGLAWASHLLSFSPEGYHAKYDAEGRNHISLARVK